MVAKDDKRQMSEVFSRSLLGDAFNFGMLLLQQTIGQMKEL